MIVPVQYMTKYHFVLNSAPILSRLQLFALHSPPLTKNPTEHRDRNYSYLLKKKNDSNWAGRLWTTTTRYWKKTTAEEETKKKQKNVKIEYSFRIKNPIYVSSKARVNTWKWLFPMRSGLRACRGWMPTLVVVKNTTTQRCWTTAFCSNERHPSQMDTQGAADTVCAGQWTHYPNLRTPRVQCQEGNRPSQSNSNGYHSRP